MVFWIEMFAETDVGIRADVYFLSGFHGAF